MSDTNNENPNVADNEPVVDTGANVPPTVDADVPPSVDPKDSQAPEDSESPDAQGDSSKNPNDVNWDQLLKLAESNADAVKEPLIREGANQAMKLTENARYENIQTLWDGMSGEAQAQILTSFNAELVKAALLPILSGLPHAWREAKGVYQIMKGESPQSEEELFADEVRVYVMLGILKPKDPTLASCMDKNFSNAATIAKVGEWVTTALGVPSLGKIFGTVSKVSKVAGIFATEILPQIREETGKRLEARAIEEAAKKGHAALAEQVGHQVIRPANNIAHYGDSSSERMAA